MDCTQFALQRTQPAVLVLGGESSGACRPTSAPGLGSSLPLAGLRTLCSAHELCCTTLCSVAPRLCGAALAGLRTLVQRECSHFLRILPAAASPSEIDSLNVSVAAGILLHSLLTRGNALAPSG